MAPTATFALEYWSNARLRASCSLEDAMAEIDSKVPLVGAAAKDEYWEEAALKAEANLALAVAKDPE